MAKVLKDKEIDINGKVIGGESLIRLNVKTAIWIIGAIFSIVMSILTWSYFDLKKDVAASEAAAMENRKEFVEKVDESVDKMEGDIQTIRIDQATIKGDIKLILDRQTRDNPVRVNPNIPVSTVAPPVTLNPSDTIQ